MTEHRRPPGVGERTVYEQELLLHLRLDSVQSTQQAFPIPQAVCDVPAWQLPDVSQQPAQVPLKHELPELPTLHIPPSG
jgi:hypothetical protein